MELKRVNCKNTFRLNWTHAPFSCLYGPKFGIPFNFVWTVFFFSFPPLTFSKGRFEYISLFDEFIRNLERNKKIMKSDKPRAHKPNSNTLTTLYIYFCRTKNTNSFDHHYKPFSFIFISFCVL